MKKRILNSLFDHLVIWFIIFGEILILLAIFISPEISIVTAIGMAGIIMLGNAAIIAINKSYDVK